MAKKSNYFPKAIVKSKDLSIIPNADNSSYEWEKHLRFVHSVATALCKKLKNFSYHDDLVQAGSLGLRDSFKSFDPSKGAFTTHAVSWIRRYMQKELHVLFNTIKLPCYSELDKKEKMEKKYKLIKVDTNFFIDKNGNTSKNLASYYDQKIYAYEPELDEDKILIKDLINKVFTKYLTHEERLFIEYKYCCNMSFSELGDEFGYSKQRAQQIDVLIKDKLKNIAEIKTAWNYLKY